MLSIILDFLGLFSTFNTSGFSAFSIFFVNNSGYTTGKVFTTGDIGLDTLTDFTPTADKLLLSKTTFAALTSIVGNGFSQATDFAVVEDDFLVETSSAFIVYNSNRSRICCTNQQSNSKQ